MKELRRIWEARKKERRERRKEKRREELQMTPPWRRKTLFSKPKRRHSSKNLLLSFSKPIELSEKSKKSAIERSNRKR